METKAYISKQEVYTWLVLTFHSSKEIAGDVLRMPFFLSLVISITRPKVLNNHPKGTR